MQNITKFLKGYPASLSKLECNKGNVMLIGISTKKTVMQQMEESDSYIFYLGGSRYFGNANAESDTDLYVQDSIAVRLFLKSLGFEYNIYAGYGNLDSNCIDVMSIGQGNQKIDVQLSKDVTKRVSAHETVKNQIGKPLSLIPKSERYKYWNAIYEELA